MFQIHTNEESHDFMEIWKLISKKKIWEFTIKKIKNSKMPHNTKLDRRQTVPEQNSVSGKIDKKNQVTHWHKNNIKSEIRH